jgi:hypothetical protein
MSRSRPRLSAAARGYDHHHRKLVTAFKAAWWPGQPCARCGQPITSLTMADRRGRIVSAVDLGHVDGSGKTAYAGLEHRFCSRSAGAKYGNRLRGQQKHAVTWATSRVW